jgi:SAM-dependent methyltransferase
MTTTTAAPEEIAIPGTHDWVTAEVTRTVPAADGARVLDIGAGHGSMSRRLLDAGYAVSACDLCPQNFQVPDIECRQVNADGALPYDDGSFDLVICIEVVEHLESHRRLFSEVRRVLAPDGRFVFTTPNVLSLKSRMTFLLTGYFYSHGPLEPTELNPVRQHISPFSLDRYRWVLWRCGLELESFTADKLQRSSMLLGGLWPLCRAWGRLRWGASSNLAEQNSATMLFGRTMLLTARKRADGAEWVS